jgi:hypothetical protein
MHGIEAVKRALREGRARLTLKPRSESDKGPTIH